MTAENSGWHEHAQLTLIYTAYSVLI